MTKYDFELDINSDNSIAVILRQVKPNSTVLEFGPASGRMTKYLKESLECITTIVEIDREAALQAAKYSNLAFVGEYGDIESYTWHRVLTENKSSYDYIMFADVLEHLYDPYQALAKAKDLLKPTGSMFISIPNVSHNSVIIDLINDKFNYRELGLLDNTHIRFFTNSSLEKMVDDAGLTIVNRMNTHCAVEDSEFKNSYDDVPSAIAKKLKQREFGDTYQFLWEAKSK